MNQSVFGLGLLAVVAAVAPLSTEAGEHYWLLDLGALWKADSRYDPDVMPSASLTYGYGFTPHWALELDYLHSLGGGDYSRIDSALPSGKESGDFSLWMTSLAISYRHLFSGSFYTKGKVAYNYSEVDRSISESGKNTLDIENTGAVGLGLGILLGDLIGSSLTSEIEFTYYSNEMMGLMIGANMTF